MLWIRFVVEFLHVFFAIFWFGATLTMFAIVTPALRACSPSAAGEAGARIGGGLTKVLAPVAGMAILFGILNATLFGPVRSLSFLWSSAYGVTVGIAFVVAIVLAGLGARIGRVGQSIATATEAERLVLLGRIARMTATAVLGFVVVLICMVLMHNGL